MLPTVATLLLQSATRQVDVEVGWPNSLFGWILLGLIAILFLPPLHLAALMAGFYCLVSAPMLMVLLATDRKTNAAIQN